MGEKLFQADRPIVAYRQRRKELIEDATRPADPAARHPAKPSAANCHLSTRDDRAIPAAVPDVDRSDRAPIKA